MHTSLSKSDFKEALGCPKRMVYKRAHYPSTNDENEFLKMLAQGGYAVGRMATLYFDNGIEVEGDRAACFLATLELMQRENVVLFEAAFQAGKREARVDILVKEGKQIHLIEVKSQGMDSTKPFDAKKYGDLLDDVAFQLLVVSESHPDMEVRCSLMMPDKSKRSGIEGLPSWFPMADRPSLAGRFNKPDVRFRFEANPLRDEYIERLRGHGILSLVDVTALVKERLPMVLANADRFLRILEEGIRTEDFRIGRHCKGCGYRTPHADRDGFGECWGSLAYPEHHIFDLYHGTALRHPDGGMYLDRLVERGTSNLLDVNPEHLQDRGGSVAMRQLIQLEHTRQGTEWISTGLAKVFQSLRYPLHFIDFETYAGALPFHEGMRPFEWIAFQWSCHTIDAPGMPPRHGEWIHTGAEFPEPATFPNFEFARSLMRHVGESGTLVRWAKHERTMLRAILGQMDVFGVDDPELRAWLENRTGEDADCWMDMQELALMHYFHPDMKGSTSIKKVLPAVWNAYPELRRLPQFLDYAPDAFAQGFHDPYDTLRSSNIVDSEAEEDPVDGGTQAMMAYARIRFDTTLDDGARDLIRQKLLDYCKLDTMAMVIIFEGWKLAMH